MLEDFPPANFLKESRIMKIKIESDVFDISKRIKDIHEGYFIVFDTNKSKFEIHNSEQGMSYCFTSKYDAVCAGMIFEIMYSMVNNIDNIIDEIDKNNKQIENIQSKKVKDDSEYMLREIYGFFNNSSKEYDEDVAFSTIWR